MNNPLKYTDPSGYFSFGDFIKTVVQTVITVVVSYYCPPCGAALAYGFAKMNGATSGQAFFAAAMAWVGGEMAQPGAAGVSEGGAMATSDVASQATAEHLAGNTVSKEAIAAGANNAGLTIEEVLVTATKESSFNSGIAIQVAGIGMAGLTPADFKQPVTAKNNTSCSGQMCRNTGPSAQEKHFARNAENDAFLKEKGLYGRNDLSVNELEGTGFKRIYAPEDKYHTWGAGNEANQKWVFDNGTRYGSYEMVVKPVDTGLMHVTDPRVMGTLNYGGNPWSHFWQDVVPYYRYGNSPTDSTTGWQRFMRTFE